MVSPAAASVVVASDWVDSGTASSGFSPQATSRLATASMAITDRMPLEKSVNIILINLLRVNFLLKGRSSTSRTSFVRYRSQKFTTGANWLLRATGLDSKRIEHCKRQE